VNGFLPRLIATAAGLWLAARLLDGVYASSAMTLLVAAFLLGFVNTIIRPIIVLLTLPITIITLGLFLLVVNAAMLGLVAWILPGLRIEGLGYGILAWLIVCAVNWLAELYIERMPRRRLDR